MGFAARMWRYVRWCMVGLSLGTESSSTDGCVWMSEEMGDGGGVWRQTHFLKKRSDSHQPRRRVHMHAEKLGRGWWFPQIDLMMHDYLYNRWRTGSSAKLDCTGPPCVRNFVTRWSTSLSFGHHVLITSNLGLIESQTARAYDIRKTGLRA